MSFSYPVMLDVTARTVVIVGGGAVAVRKAKGVLDAGVARVRVVSPAVRADMPTAVERVAERYAERHLDGAGLVFAATDVRAVNDAVVRDCRARGILVNRADSDDDLPGDFATPAQLRRGPVTVTVSAGSAALAATIRDGVAGRWDERWSRMAEAMRELRPAIVNDAALTPARRSRMLRALATDEAMDRLESGGLASLLNWVAEASRK